MSSVNIEESHITRCPNGCDTTLRDSALELPEGLLRYCDACGHLLSRCSKTLYLRSNEEWDIETGTWPSPKDLRRLEARRKRTLKTISELLGKANPDIHLLDVGCSSGAFVWIAERMGFRAEGVEPAEKPARAGRERGLTIHSGFLEELRLPRSSFDAVTLFEVIEHLDKPTALLDECHRLLKPGGILVVGTGNTDSWTRRILKNHWDFFDLHQHGGHISFFSPRSIEVLAGRTGFRVKKVSTSSVKLTEKGHLPYPLYRLAKAIAQLMNPAAKALGKGHQMELYLISTKPAVEL